VIVKLATIGYGTTRSYANVAAELDRPRAVRAVGTACAQNPLPIVLPCHRVVRSDGSTGQYAGGAETKVALIEMERHA
jgi:methylated-DNA-[protein]-cysteine S-methyltransferase